MASLKAEKPTGDTIAMPPKAAQIMHKFKDVMPPELPKSLMPIREANYRIEFMSNIRPSTMAPYQMAPPKLRLRR